MNLEEYYKHYLSLHRNKWCRRLHLFGQLTTVLFVVFCIRLHLWPALLLAPLVVYPFAWSGHYFFEKNIPAAFSSPIKAKICDWLMTKDILTGKIEL